MSGSPPRIGRPALAGGALLAAALLAAAVPGSALAASAPSSQATSAGRWSLLLALAGLVVVLPLALWVLELVAATLHSKRPSPPVVLGWIRGAAIGADKRVSTSKTVAVVWTYSLASVLLAIVIAKLWGHPEGLDVLNQSGLQSEYAVLIGGPLGAAILAKGIVTSQLANGQASKPASSGAKAGDLVSNDAGGTDLGDLQYVLFNTVALVFFFGEFLSNPTAGLPSIPNVLAGLTTVSAAGYVGKKVLTPGRTIASVRPSTVASTDWDEGGVVHFTAVGTGLLNGDGSAPSTVRFGADGDGTKITLSVTADGTTLDFDVAGKLPAGTYALHVLTDQGQATKTGALTVT